MNSYFNLYNQLKMQKQADPKPKPSPYAGYSYDSIYEIPLSARGSEWEQKKNQLKKKDLSSNRDNTGHWSSYNFDDLQQIPGENRNQGYYDQLANVLHTKKDVNINPNVSESWKGNQDNYVKYIKSKMFDPAKDVTSLSGKNLNAMYPDLAKIDFNSSEFEIKPDPYKKNNIKWHNQQPIEWHDQDDD